MSRVHHDVAWLIALEATLSFSVPVWCSSAWGRPATYPGEFAVVVLGVASACALVFHVAPARVAGRYAPLGARMSWGFVPLAVGYAAHVTRLLMAMHGSMKLTNSSIGLALLLLSIGGLALSRSWWKFAAVVALLSGMAVSAYMLTTPWRGIWIGNTRFATEPVPNSVYLAEGLFLALAPAFAIAWRIGCVERRTRHVWLSAFLGLFLPVVLSASIAALMAQAGENLFWRPSLFLDFIWALQGHGGPHGPRAWNVLQIVLGLGLVGPALVAALSVRFLAEGFNAAKKAVLAVSAVTVVAYVLVEPPNPSFYPPYDLALSVWALALAVLGFAGGLACLFGQPPSRLGLGLTVANTLGAMCYLVLVSRGWAIVQEREMGLYSATGERFVWPAAGFPVLAVFLVTDLVWAGTIVVRRDWRAGRLWLTMPLIWLASLWIDFSHH